MRTLVFLDGSVADPDAPQLRVDDLGLQRGDGVFETILVVDGRPRELSAHLDRLARSAAMLDLLAPDRAAWERVIEQLIGSWRGEREMAMKLVYTRGVEGAGAPTGFALGFEVDGKIRRARAEGVAVVTLDRGIDPGLAARAPWLLLGAKSLSYGINMAAVREANRRGADDAIFLATDGSVLEGPTSTVVIARDRTLYTPPANTGILAGTTQAGLFRGAEAAGWSVKVEPLDLAELREADGVFLASAIRKVTRVRTLDGEPLPDSRAVHAELVTAYESAY